ncbi:trichohyalin-like [Sinocyclocheilus grahami]|uniref:trichohyalin-like n=1 Tax=Sinocyclocheilus grahami TaxID=75366 RepID=UPI0007AD1709|nr:PREDICTED: trichohyalin-like [Sinocyclocheilus grahami]
MWFQSQDSREREDELRIVLLGKTGVGKSSTGNTILGRKVFLSDISEKSVTKECQKETAEISGRHITVIDTPGLFDTELSNEEIQREISNSISMILPGPHVFIIVLNLGQRFTKEEATAVEIIQETFGENSLMFTMVLFTRGDDLNGKTIEQYLGEPGSALKNLTEACGNRYHVFNNKETGDRTQVTDLLQKIDNMVKENGGSYYSCKIFREKERELQEQQMKILMEKVEQVVREREELMNKHKEEKKKMKMKIEEERQNHEKERKRREDEFIEKEGQYKRDILEREEQERKIREELKREREEWEKQKQQERQRREEEEEKWRKKEQEKWDEYNQRLKEERKRMEREKEDVQYKHEKEKKQMKMMKTDIKSIDEQERKIREEMKSEREEWEKQKQEREREREEERHIFNELYTESSEDEEDSSSESGCLRILLFGRTGSGKSATGNNILGNVELHREASSQSVTTVCQKRVGEVDGQSVAVIDTPGLFDPSLTNEQVQEEIMKCVSLSAPGPHAFIIVLSVEKITPEEKDTLDMIKMIFGSKAADFCIVLFTRGDDLRGQTMEQYVEKSKDTELKTLTSECGNRFLAFNNTETQDQTQVTQLLNMIEEMNQGRYFTNEMFEEAAISIEHIREIIKENERQNQSQVEELKVKYDMEFESMKKRLEEKKQKIHEEKQRLQNKFSEQEERLRREFEEKEKSDQEKRETEDQKQSEEEKQQRAEYDQRIEKMKREIEDLRIQYEKQQKEREEEDDRTRDEKYKQSQEKMKNYHEHGMTEERKQKEREYEEKIKEMKRFYEQLEGERKEERKRIKQEDEERRVEKRWEKMMEDLKREQEEEIKRREREETERIDREEKECDEMKQNLEEEIEKMEKKHEDEAREQREELNDFRKRKEQHVQELKERLEEFQKQLNKVKRLRMDLEDKWTCHVM